MLANSIDENYLKLQIAGNFAVGLRMSHIDRQSELQTAALADHHFTEAQSMHAPPSRRTKHAFVSSEHT
eukprot:6210779-Pleurochrysis_carterae.AAC.2